MAPYSAPTAEGLSVIGVPFARPLNKNIAEMRGNVATGLGVPATAEAALSLGRSAHVRMSAGRGRSDQFPIFYCSLSDENGLVADSGQAHSRTKD